MDVIVNFYDMSLVREIFGRLLESIIMCLEISDKYLVLLCWMVGRCLMEEALIRSRRQHLHKR